MARRIVMLLGLLLVFSISASAQSTGLFAGYSFQHFGASPGRTLNGVEISAQRYFTSWFRTVSYTHLTLPTILRV